MNLNEFAKEVHSNAVEHGWWDEERSFAEIIALIHSELSEALEEYRNGNPNLYYRCEYHDTRMKCPDKFNGCQYGENEGCNIRKPEGIAVELADVIIRILDYCGKDGVDINSALKVYTDQNRPRTLPELIAECHYYISDAYSVGSDPTVSEYREQSFAFCINSILYYCANNGIDIKNIMIKKHEYNKTRPYKHGGKVI